MVKVVNRSKPARTALTYAPRYEDGRQPVPESSIIFHDTAPSLTDDERRAKRRRIEEHAAAYLRGGDLHIQTSGFREPFGKEWKNPWRSMGFVIANKPAFTLAEKVVTPVKSVALPTKPITPAPTVPIPQPLPIADKVKTKAKAVTVKLSRISKTKGKKMRHDTSFFKALPLAKQGVSAFPQKAGKGDLNHEPAKPVSENKLPDNSPIPATEILLGAPSRHQNAGPQIAAAAVAEEPTADSRSKFQFQQELRAKEFESHAMELEARVTTNSVPVEVARPADVDNDLQVVALQTLIEMHATAPSGSSPDHAVDDDPIRQHTATATHPILKPPQSNAHVSIEPEYVAHRTRRKLRTRNSCSALGMLTDLVESTPAIEPAIENDSVEKITQTPIVPTSAEGVADDAAQIQEPSNESMIPYIPSFPERQDSKAYTLETLDSQTASPLPKKRRTRSEAPGREHDRPRKRASFAENLARAQDENVEPSSPSQSATSKGGASSQQLESNGRLRSCLKSVSKTDRRNNESPVSSQQREHLAAVPADVSMPSPTTVRKHRRQESIYAAPHSDSSVLPLAFPSVSFLPSASHPGSAAMEAVSGTFQAFAYENEGQGGMDLFGRFGLISREDDGEEDPGREDVEKSVEDMVRFLDTDYIV